MRRLTCAPPPSAYPNTGSPPTPPCKRRCRAKIADPNWFVRTQLAGTLGYLPAAQRTAPLVDILTRYGDDRIVTDAAISSLAGQESAVLQTLLAQPAAKADSISMLTAAVTRKRDFGPDPGPDRPGGGQPPPGGDPGGPDARLGGRPSSPPGWPRGGYCRPPG